MDFFEKVAEKAEQAGKFVCEKADVTKEFIKLEYRANTLRASLEKEYKKLGKTVYRVSVTECEDDGKTQEYVDAITALRAELKTVTDQLKKYKTVCKNCGALTLFKSEYCDKCGKPIK